MGNKLGLKREENTEDGENRGHPGSGIIINTGTKVTMSKHLGTQMQNK